MNQEANILNGRVGSKQFLSGGEAQTPEEKLQLQMEGLADQLIHYSLRLQKDDRLLIQMGPNESWQLTSMVMKKARALGVEVILRFVDSKNIQPAVMPVLKSMSAILDHEEGLLAQSQGTEKIYPRANEATTTDDVTAFIHHGVLNDELDDVIWATHVLVIREDVTSTEKLSTEDIYKKGQAVVTSARLEKPWCLVYAPTQQQADAAQMTLEEYSIMYYEACNRDWEKVEQAQSELVELLTDVESVRVEAGAPEGWDQEKWKTDVTMSINGMIAANSVARRNMPGSEVFLAPVRHTLEGQYTLPYPVRFGKRVLPNIGFEFKRGKVVNFWIHEPNEGDEEYVREVLATDDTAEVGELGIGTNPRIKEAYTNTLLVEKAAGSIHLALGDAYRDKSYLGTPISVDNGVQSRNHIDLTRMMTPQYGGGRFTLNMKENKPDGKKQEHVLQEDGRFIDSRFAIFNE